jgi:hypothetical protein
MDSVTGGRNIALLGALAGAAVRPYLLSRQIYNGFVKESLDILDT